MRSYVRFMIAGTLMPMARAVGYPQRRVAVCMRNIRDNFGFYVSALIASSLLESRFFDSGFLFYRPGAVRVSADARFIAA